MSEKGNQIFRQVFFSTKTHELATGFTLTELENFRDKHDNPEIYALSPDQLSPPPTSGIEHWVFHHIGDVMEVCELFAVTRLSLFALDQAQSKITHKHVPDEACFWTSMLVSVSIPALIELNKLPLKYQGDPADLFGIGVAATALVGTHYLSKYREPIKQKILPSVKKVIQTGKKVINKIENFRIT